MREAGETTEASQQESTATTSVTLVLVSRRGGGALRVVALLAENWARRGRSVRVMTNLVDAPEWSMRPEDVELVPLPPLPPASSRWKSIQAIRFGRYVIMAGLACRRDARTRGSEPFVAFLPGTALLVLSATIGLASRVIVCERNDLTRQPVPLIVRLGRRLLYPRSAFVTVNHPGSQRAAERIAGRSPTTLLVNPAPSPADPADVRGSRVMLNVGRLVIQKNQQALLEAFGRVISTISADWRLWVVGDGPLRSILEQARGRLQLEDAVRLIGHVADIDPRYRAAAFLVLTSAWEGTPNVVLEAQAHGLPVVLPTTIADGSDLVTDGEDGLVYDPAVHGDLDRCLCSLMDDADLRVRLGLAAWERAKQRHEQDAPGDWLRLIDSLPAAPP